ncbi:MAG: S-adenosylmethionine:tRNA ribosyltransferase-isomerase [Mariprofundaceae bacterium]|nr:S-adenosylmethionine:tRNA ribosyltransferase-isomerase [Mariprofundaceae bacterium]
MKMLAFIMHFTTLTLPNLYLPKQRQPARSAQQKLADQLAKLKQKSFIQLGECFEKFIPKNCALIFNDTKVIKARLFGVKPSGGKIELLINRALDAHNINIYI